MFCYAILNYCGITEVQRKSRVCYGDCYTRFEWLFIVKDDARIDCFFLFFKKRFTESVAQNKSQLLRASFSAAFMGPFRPFQSTRIPVFRSPISLGGCTFRTGRTTWRPPPPRPPRLQQRQRQQHLHLRRRKKLSSSKAKLHAVLDRSRRWASTNRSASSVARKPLRIRGRAS